MARVEVWDLGASRSADKAGRPPLQSRVLPTAAGNEMGSESLGTNIRQFARALRQIEAYLTRERWTPDLGAGWSDESWFSDDPDAESDLREARSAAREILRLLARGEAVPDGVDPTKLRDACLSVRQDPDFDVPQVRKILDQAALLATDQGGYSTEAILRFEPRTQQVLYRGHEIRLRKTPYRMFLALARKAGEFVDGDRLMVAVRGSEDRSVGSPVRWMKDHKLSIMRELRKLVGEAGVTEEDIEGLIESRSGCLRLCVRKEEVRIAEPNLDVG